MLYTKQSTHLLAIRLESQRNGAQQLICIKKGSNIFPVTEPKRPNVMISNRTIVLQSIATLSIN